MRLCSRCKAVPRSSHHRYCKKCKAAFMRSCATTYRSILHVELTREMSEADKIEIRERISKAFEGLKDFRLSYMTEVEDL